MTPEQWNEIERLYAAAAALEPSDRARFLSEATVDEKIRREVESLLSYETDAAMLFVRYGNGGVSHSPREIITAEDADIAARIVLDAVLRLAETS